VVTGSLDAEADRAGSLEYYGNPQVTKMTLAWDIESLGANKPAEKG